MLKLTFCRRPAEIECSQQGWSHQEASCDATNGGLTPGAQIALIIFALAILCAATFFWQKYYKRNNVTRKLYIYQYPSKIFVSNILLMQFSLTKLCFTIEFLTNRLLEL